MTAQYVYLIIFACAAYLIVTDESVAKAFYYVIKILQNQFTIFRWWLIHNPRTPWAQYSMWRRSNQMAKELMKELEKNNEL
jgi:hypothetical protein